MNAPIDWTYTKAAPAQLCQLAGRWKGEALPGGGMMAETKVDGWRANHFRGYDGKPGLWTRNGHPIGGIGHILHALGAIEEIAGQRMFFDGEFLVGGTLLATKAWCESGWKLGGEAGTLHLFDCMTEAEWRAGGSSTPFIQRKARLRSLFDAWKAQPEPWEWREGTHGAEPSTPSVEMLDDAWVSTPDDVWDMARGVWARDGEGIMLKDAEAGYVRGRSNAWLKVKRDGVR